MKTKDLLNPAYSNIRLHESGEYYEIENLQTGEKEDLFTALMASFRDSPFVRQTERVRLAQKQYFRMQTKRQLEISKEAERALDDMIEQVKRARDGKQGALFQE